MNETTTLGALPIRRVGYGAMQLAGPGVFGPPADHDGALAVLRRAVELGVDHVDTAQFYGPDVVNDLIREALHPYPADFKLVTKIGARRDDRGAWLPVRDVAGLRADVETNLRSLGVEQLALVNLRLLGEDDGTEVGAEARADQLGLMADLQREGKIANIGLSNVSTAGLAAALELVDVAGVQNAYSIIDRTDEATLDLCRAHDIAYVPYFPLGSAFTGGHQVIAAEPGIAGVATKHGVTPSQVALAWLLDRYDRILLIPGTKSIAHLEENLAVASITLDDEDRAALDAVEPAAAGTH